MKILDLNKDEIAFRPIEDYVKHFKGHPSFVVRKISQGLFENQRFYNRTNGIVFAKGTIAADVVISANGIIKMI